MALPIAGMALTLLGGKQAAQGYKQLGAAESQMALYQQAVAKNNAIIAQYNEDYTAAAGDVAMGAQVRKVQSAAGETRAALADKGIDINSGSAAAVQESQADLGMLDAAILRNNVLKSMWNFKMQKSDAEAQAELYGMQSKYALMAGKIKAKSSMLGSYASVFNQATKTAESFFSFGKG